MMKNYTIFLTLLLSLLVVISACQRHERESVYVSVPDKSITPIKHYKQHEIKMKCGRTVKFTLPAEFSDKYSSVGHAHFSGEDLVEQYHYGIKNNHSTFFSITSFETGKSYNFEKQSDMRFIRETIKNRLMGNIVPIIEKKVDETGHIFYFVYAFEAFQPNYYENERIIISKCYSHTLYRDTLYEAELVFQTDANHYDFPTYRKIMESVEIR